MGGVTPSSIFFRSESIDRISDAGWRTLSGLGVRSVIDLRQDVERDRDIGRRPAWLETTAVDHDGLANQEFWAEPWSDGRAATALYYLPHVEAMPERTVAVLDALAAAPPGGVLFHCTAGRDRTGLIAAILLTVAAVNPEDIVADYLLSTGRAAHSSSGQETECDAVCAAFGTTAEGAFRTALAGLDVQPLLNALSDTARDAIITWRGALPSSGDGG